MLCSSALKLQFRLPFIFAYPLTHSDHVSLKQDAGEPAPVPADKKSAVVCEVDRLVQPLVCSRCVLCMRRTTDRLWKCAGGLSVNKWLQ